MTTHARRAFTLMELLVVLLILGVLIGLLIPTALSARRSAVLTKCATQLRQIGAAAIAYRTDHRQWPIVKPLFFDVPKRLPIAQMSEEEARVAVAPVLPVALGRYVPVESPVYRCPGDTDGLIFDRVRTLVGHGQSYIEWFPLLGFGERKGEPIFKQLLADFSGMGWSMGGGGGIPNPKFHVGPLRGNAVKTDGSVETIIAQTEAR